MDLSIVASIGSFMVSERLLPPKSIIAISLGGLFLYDLSMYSHDHGSLRVYRGPGLLAFVLLCSAFSLRIWRRNGVACDELLFLPGTLFAEKYNGEEMIELTSYTEKYEREEVIELGNEEILPLKENEETDEDDKEKNEEEEDWHCEYSPSGPSVFGASLDLIFPVLFNFHLFTDASSSHPSQDIPPEILPIIFLSILLGRIVFPPSRRLRFFGVLFCFLKTPFLPITFRDDVFGDVLTSFVGLIKDVTFALFFYVTIIPGTVRSSYGLKETFDSLENNHVLHSIVLPILAMSLLWFKFLQSLRFAYDKNSRWPLLNSLKYLLSSLVILHAIHHPLNERGLYWYIGFVIATLYQIYWDVFMDWELLMVEPLRDAEFDVEGFTISSMTPYSFWFERWCLKPIRFLGCSNNFSNPFKVKLRTTRLFSSDLFYYKILIFNCLVRCCWMISFFPFQHFDSDGTIIRSFSLPLSSFITFTVTVLEISRRCLWTILKVELESIKSKDPNYQTPKNPLEILLQPLNSKFQPLKSKFTQIYSYISIDKNESQSKRFFFVEMVGWVLASIYLAYITY